MAPSIRRIRFHDTRDVDAEKDFNSLFFATAHRFNGDFLKFFGEAWQRGDQVEAGETVSLALRFDRPGHLMLTSPINHAVAHVPIKEGVALREQSFDLQEGPMIPETATLGVGPIKLKLKNRCRYPLVVGVYFEVEGTATPPPAVIDPENFLTGKKLLTNQTFRDLFQTESMPAKGGIELKSLTFLFTDLKGSTELYDRIGDLRAYGLVEEHFDVLRSAVSESGGAVVKTIGDAVMATFSEAGPALEAAARMKRDVARVGQGDLHLKIGAHMGPCIAVTSNDRLDYFGQTVNIASRVQGIAEANEIVVTEAVFDAPGSDRIAAASSFSVRRDTAVLRGVDGVFSVVRLR